MKRREFQEAVSSEDDSSRNIEIPSSNIDKIDSMFSVEHLNNLLPPYF